MRSPATRSPKSSADPLDGGNFAKPPIPNFFYFPENTFSPRYSSNFFTFSMDGFEFEPDDEKCFLAFCQPSVHAVYKIKVKNGRDTRIVRARFREILALAAEVESSPATLAGPTLAGAQPLAPPKTILPNIEDDFVLKRSELLGDYLDKMFRWASSRQGFPQDHPIAYFLKLERY